MVRLLTELKAENAILKSKVAVLEKENKELKAEKANSLWNGAGLHGK